MTAGEVSSSLGAGKSHEAGGGDALSPLLTVQQSSTTEEAVAALRNWVRGENTDEHCVITGPSGSGRTHMLDALAGVLPPDQTVRCSSADSDWKVAIQSVESGEGRRVLVDDLDRYDNAFLKQLFARVAGQKHRIVASVKTFDGRLARLWTTHLSRPRDLRLGPPSERIEDVAAFVPHWARINGSKLPNGVAFSETVRLLMAMKLPRGFSDLARLLDEVASLGETLWDPPDATVWIGAYTRIVMGPGTTRPAILVEGDTDAIYLQWISEVATGSPPGDLEIEPCQSASKIPQKAFACRNEGRRAVALFDFDRLGLDLHEHMKLFDLSSVVIPKLYDPLAGCAPDHVHQVVEIEDLLPIAQVERFVTQTGRQPELVIHAPRLGVKRIVIDSRDKFELARWVHKNLGAESAEHLLGLYNELRRKLGLAPVFFQASAD